jgi:hypothetical protein
VRSEPSGARAELRRREPHSRACSGRYPADGGEHPWAIRVLSVLDTLALVVQLDLEVGKRSSGLARDYERQQPDGLAVLARGCAVVSTWVT